MMREARQQVEELFYGNVMFARGRAGRALTILHAQMRADGLQPNSFCYNAAVGTASRSKRWRQAIAPKEEMEAEIIRTTIQVLRRRSIRKGTSAHLALR